LHSVVIEAVTPRQTNDSLTIFPIWHQPGTGADSLK
jgi:hypothetical protein